MRSGDVAILIPVYGQLDLLESMLRSILATGSRYTFDLVLIDDASPGGLGNIPHHYCIDTVITRAQNGGFTSAINEGLLRLGSTYEHVILLNSDMQVLSGWLDALIERALSDRNIGIVGGMELAIDDPDLIVCGGSRPVIGSDSKLTNILLLDRQGKVSRGDYQKAERVEWASFGVALLTKRCISEVGLLDGRFINYFSDADYGLRANRGGFEVWYEPKCKVLHAQHSSSGLGSLDSLISFQYDREQYCEKWYLPSLPVGYRKQQWIRWQYSDKKEWKVNPIPHLVPGAPVSAGIRAKLAGEQAHLIDLVFPFPHLNTLVPEPKGIIGDALAKLYEYGLAFVESHATCQVVADGPLDRCNLHILAPHSDDAAASLGGTLLRRKAQGARTKVNVIFGKSDYAIGPLAGLGEKAISKLRAFEEVAYCAMVNADYSILPNADRLLRQPNKSIYYSDYSEIELDIVSTIVEQLLPLLKYSDSYIIAPLGAGLMADHALVAVAAAMLVQLGLSPDRLLVYEDLPYSAMPGAVSSGLGLYSRFGISLVPKYIDVSWWFRQKCELLSIYTSQMTDELLSKIEQQAYASTVLHGGAGQERWRRMERIWQVEAYAP